MYWGSNRKSNRKSGSLSSKKGRRNISASGLAVSASCTIGFCRFSAGMAAVSPVMLRHRRLRGESDHAECGGLYNRIITSPFSLLVRLLILPPNFGGRIPPNAKFWDMNRHFQANRAKYLKFHIIETTRRFQPNFAQ